jgi:hypothetical protein
MNVPLTIKPKQNQTKWFDGDVYSMYMAISQKRAFNKNRTFFDFNQVKKDLREKIFQLREEIYNWSKENSDYLDTFGKYGYMSISDLFILNDGSVDKLNKKTKFNIAEFAVLSKIKNNTILTYEQTDDNTYKLKLFETFLANIHRNYTFDNLLNSDDVYVLLKKQYGEYGLYIPTQQLGGGQINQVYNLDILSKRLQDLFVNGVFPYLTGLYVRNDQIFNALPKLDKFYITNDVNVEIPELVKQSVISNKFDNIFGFTNTQQQYHLFIISNEARIQDIDNLSEISKGFLYYSDVLITQFDFANFVKRFVYKDDNLTVEIVMKYNSTMELKNNLNNGATVGDCRIRLDNSRVQIELVGEINKTPIKKERNIFGKIVKLTTEKKSYVEVELYDLDYDYQRIKKLMDLTPEQITEEVVYN